MDGFLPVEPLGQPSWCDCSGFWDGLFLEKPHLKCPPAAMLKP